VKLRTVLDSFPGGICLLDEEGYLTAWNESWRSFFDLPPEFFLKAQIHIVDLFDYNVARGEYAEFGNTYEERKRVFLSYVMNDAPYAYERTRVNGVVIEVRGAPITTGGWVMTCVDVTENRQIQKEYKRQTILLNAVLNNMPQGLSVYDTNLQLQVWNQTFVSMYDFSPDQVYRNVAFADLMRISAKRGEFDGADAERHIGELESFLRRFESHQIERTRKNGDTHLIYSNPIWEDGTLQGFVTTYTDITSLKNAERALEKANQELEKNVADRTQELESALDDLIRSEKMAALGSLVAGVSHELNTPIGNSLLIASTLKANAKTISGKFNEGQIKRSELNSFLLDTNHASDLLERSLVSAADLITSFKQVAVDQASSKRRVFNLVNVVHDIVATLMSKIRNAGLTLHLDIAPNLELDSYPGPLEQVISNLIDNAILHGFHEQAGGDITIMAQSLDQDYIEIRFMDNGVGIHESDIAKIFDPFFTTKLGKGGSGLGLNIVYNIVTVLLGGKVSVESSYSAGACFVLRLPRCAPLETN
jgi:signal transduction histidine kinase